MAYKCKVFETLSLTLHGHYTHVCTVSIVIGINTEKKYVCQTKIHVFINDRE